MAEEIAGNADRGDNEWEDDEHDEKDRKKTNVDFRTPDIALSLKSSLREPIVLTLSMRPPHPEYSTLEGDVGVEVDMFNVGIWIVWEWYGGGVGVEVARRPYWRARAKVGS